MLRKPTPRLGAQRQRLQAATPHPRKGPRLCARPANILQPRAGPRHAHKHAAAPGAHAMQLRHAASLCPAVYNHSSSALVMHRRHPRRSERLPAATTLCKRHASVTPRPVRRLPRKVVGALCAPPDKLKERAAAAARPAKLGTHAFHPPRAETLVACSARAGRTAAPLPRTRRVACIQARSCNASTPVNAHRPTPSLLD